MRLKGALWCGSFFRSRAKSATVAMKIISRDPQSRRLYLPIRQIDFTLHLSGRALLLALLCLLVTTAFAKAPERAVRVLILYYGDKDAPALDQFENGMRTRMEQELNAPVTIYTESFDVGWLGENSSFGDSIEEFLREKYTLRGIDVIVPVGEYPFRFVQARHKTLLPGAKIVYFTLGRSPQGPISDATGMVLQFNLGPTIEQALIQNPGTRHVYLIAGSTDLDRATLKIAVKNTQKYLQEKRETVDLQTLPVGTLTESRKILGSLPQDTVAVFVMYYGDSIGNGFVPARIVGAFSAFTNRPMYSWWDSTLGNGIVGGNLLDLQANGELFGNLVVRVIRGEKPESIPESAADLSQNMYDWRQLTRWGIPLNRIPPGSRVINQEFTAWQLYKWRIIGLIILIIVEAILIVILTRLAVSLRRRTKNLAYRRSVQALIAACAAAFIKLPPALVDNEIEILFQRLLEFFDLDLIKLFQFAPETGTLRLLCARRSAGVEQPPVSVDLRQLQWAEKQFQQGESVLVHSVDQLPPEAGTFETYLRSNGILSFAGFPLLGENGALGALSFSTVRSSRIWEPDLVQALRTIADIFGSALERKYAEEAASASRNRLIGMVESAMDAIIAIDDQHRIIVFNASAEQMFGCSADEALGQSIERFIPLRFRAHHRQHVERFSEVGDTSRSMGGLGTIMALRINGQEFPIEASISQVKVGNNKVFTVIIRDITERLQSEQKLRESSDLNLSILQSLKEHLAVLDSSGVVIAATARGAESVPISRTETEGLCVGDNYLEKCKAAVRAGDEDAATALNGIHAVYDGTVKLFEMEYDNKLRADRRWFAMSVTPLTSSGGGVVISSEDITVRKRNEQAIRELSGRLINAQEQERARIARELHDDINQQVAMLAIELRQLNSQFPGESPERSEQVELLWKKTHALSLDIQRISHQLHSSKLDHLGIVAALRGLCNEVSEQINIKIDFQFRQVPSTISSDISLSIFRVAQESLHNIAKHAHAQKVRVELSGTRDAVVLRVSDDGIGFDSDAPENGSGLGMISMSERVRSAGGSISISSKPSLGTQIEATIPLSNEQVVTVPMP
jgi:PAS domain S-box-containing protein